jgi:Putative peptidoglycan binding domain
MLERLVMRLIKGALASLVLTGILTVVPYAAFAHGGGGGGGGGHGGGGGGHGLGGGGHASFGGGHAFSGFATRGFSPGFRGTRVFSLGRFRGDNGRFREHDFGHHGNLRDREVRHRHFFNDFDFVGFGFPDWWYPDYGYADYGYSDEDADNDSAQAYGDQYWQDLAMKVQWALSRRGYYHGPIDGVIGPDGISAIREFQEAQGLPATGRIDPNVLRALKLPIPKVILRAN